MQRFHYGMIAIALLAGTSLAVAQQEKTQQNSADEALTRSAPEAKDQPQAPPAARQNEASQPGTQQNNQPFTDGKLSVPAAPQGAQADPAKFNARNDQIDHAPILAYPLLLSDEEKGALYQQLSQLPAASVEINAKPSQQVPTTLELQELPADLAAKLPGIRDYKFLRLSDRILVVNPRESVVVGELTK
jgi:hypothetical protein